MDKKRRVEKRGSPEGWAGKCEYCGFPTHAVACPNCGLWSGREYRTSQYHEMRMSSYGCNICAKPITMDELNWYGRQCEQCIREEHESLQNWRAGEPNEKYDKAFGGPERVIQ